jgi:hypothetical protein
MVVLGRLASKKVHDIIYEARINCMRNWYAEHRKINFDKKVARKKHMKVWQYLQVCKLAYF